jgi:putative DNA primase/helicase
MTDDPVDRLLSRLENVRPISTGGHVARCPAHHDQHNSLKIDRGDDGQALIYCHTGCTPEQVMSALDLSLADLFVAPDPAVLIRSNGHGRKLIRTTRYEVPTVDGEARAVHVREDYSDGSKRMWWETPDGRQGLNGIKLSDLQLYGLPSLQDSDEVVVVEGEKAGDAGRGLGVPFVATVTGASAIPSDASLNPLLGRTVYLWPDNDEPGLKHMDRVAHRLIELGQKPDAVRRVAWEKAPEKGDVADWVAKGGKPIHLRKRLDTATMWAVDAAEDTTGETEPTTEKRFVWTISELLAENFPPIQPIVGGIIDRAGATSLFGAGGAGKSWLSLSLSISIATGTPWLDHFPTVQGRVLIIDQEGRPDRVQARLQRLCQASAVTPETPLIYARPSGWRVDKETGFSHVQALIDEHAPDLVVIDSGTRFHQADENKSQEMASVAQRLAELTTDCGIALLIIDHANKISTSDDPRARLRGSTDKLNALDSALFVERRVGEQTLNVTPVKSRYDVEMPPFAIVFDHSDGLTRLIYQESASTSATPDDAIAAIGRLTVDDPYGATIDTIGFSLFPTPLMTSSQRSYRTRQALSSLERQGRIVRVDVPREGARGGRKTAYQIQEQA